MNSCHGYVEGICLCGGRDSALRYEESSKILHFFVDQELGYPFEARKSAFGSVWISARCLSYYQLRGYQVVLWTGLFPPLISELLPRCSPNITAGPRR